MQIIGMQISIDDYPGRSGSWHRVGRLAEAGSGFGSGARSRDKTMISGGKIQLKEKQNRRKGGKKVPVCE